jgi:hypothetical protein
MPIVAGDSTIPKWVLAHVTDSRDRKGLIKSLGEKLTLQLILGFLLLLSNFPLLSNGFILFFLGNPWRMLWLFTWFLQIFIVAFPILRTYPDICHDEDAKLQPCSKNPQSPTPTTA